jgi:hypothetical protein
MGHVSNKLQALITTGGAFSSMVVRSKITSHSANRAKRSENLKFVLLTEVSGLLAWIGVLTALVEEGIHHEWKDSFDGDAKGVLALEVLIS